VRPFLRCCLFLAFALPLHAQEPAGAATARALLEEGAFSQAREAVLELWAAEGDALRGDARASALFLKAVLSLDARDAETDLTRITVEHPFSPDADAALLRLALLRLERGDSAAAVRLLGRLESDYPQSPLLAAAERWRRGIALDPPLADPALPAAAAAPAATGGWAVQVGAFRAEAGAVALVAELSRRGFEGAARPRSPDGLIRVRLGGHPGARAAEAVARQLRAAGFEAVVVRDDR
jgi:ATP/maltotriose-dependent transcriptional regulator MalT